MQYAELAIKAIKKTQDSKDLHQRMVASHI